MLEGFLDQLLVEGSRLSAQADKAGDFALVDDLLEVGRFVFPGPAFEPFAFVGEGSFVAIDARAAFQQEAFGVEVEDAFGGFFVAEAFAFHAFAYGVGDADAACAFALHKPSSILQEGDFTASRRLYTTLGADA